MPNRQSELRPADTRRAMPLLEDPQITQDGKQLLYTRWDTTADIWQTPDISSGSNKLIISSISMAEATYCSRWRDHWL